MSPLPKNRHFLWSKPNTWENVPSDECGGILHEEEVSQLIHMNETEVESVTAPEHQSALVRKPPIKRPQPQAPVKPIPQPRSLPKKPIPPPRPPPRQLLKNVQADSNTCDVAELIEVVFLLNSIVTDDDIRELPAVLTISAEQEDQEKITMESLLETGISVLSCSKLPPSIPVDLPVSVNESDNSVNEIAITIRGKC